MPTLSPEIIQLLAVFASVMTAPTFANIVRFVGVDIDNTVHAAAKPGYIPALVVPPAIAPLIDHRAVGCSIVIRVERQAANTVYYFVGAVANRLSSASASGLGLAVVLIALKPVMHPLAFVFGTAEEVPIGVEHYGQPTIIKDPGGPADILVALHIRLERIAKTRERTGGDRVGVPVTLEAELSDIDWNRVGGVPEFGVQKR